MDAAAVFAGGCLGSLARHGVGLLIPDGGGIRFPWATFCVNLAGSLALGWLAGYAGRRAVPDWLKEGLGTGLLGGFTTFGAVGAQLWELLSAGAYGTAVAYGAGSAIGGFALAWYGVRLGENGMRSRKKGESS
ncbi:MAG: hypothetical protein BAA02_06380 [Paenibacillaceae bacterium ZCTH02-B3]|nr:MAG: hypothetical protein BAA02_06380 [Paenibacillaceae bacterium ZCTH02-B3]